MSRSRSEASNCKDEGHAEGKKSQAIRFFCLHLGKHVELESPYLIKYDSRVAESKPDQSFVIRTRRGPYRVTLKSAAQNEVFIGTCSKCLKKKFASRCIRKARSSKRKCNPSCQQARGPDCKCGCEGDNHGCGPVFDEKRTAEKKIQKVKTTKGASIATTANPTQLVSQMTSDRQA